MRWAISIFIVLHYTILVLKFEHRLPQLLRCGLGASSDSLLSCREGGGCCSVLDFFTYYKGEYLHFLNCTWLLEGLALVIVIVQ